MVILIASMLFKRVDIFVLDKKIISNFQCAEIGEWSIFIKSNIFGGHYICRGVRSRKKLTQPDPKKCEKSPNPTPKFTNILPTKILWEWHALLTSMQGNISNKGSDSHWPINKLKKSNDKQKSILKLKMIEDSTVFVQHCRCCPKLQQFHKSNPNAYLYSVLKRCAIF